MELYDAASDGRLLLGLTQCVDLGDFAAATPLKSPDRTQIALFDASSCPSSLEMSEEQFAQQFRGKVAVWLSSFPSNITCEPDFYRPAQWYRRLLDAGALGVVSLVPYTGRVAGYYSDRFTRSRVFVGTEISDVPVSGLIPFVMCAIPEVGLEGASSQSALTSFLDNWHKDPGARESPFDSAIYVGNITTTPNPWTSLYASPTYVAAFRAFLPLLFFATFLLAARFTHERLIKTRNPKRSFKSQITGPIVAMQIEGLIALFYAMFLAVDGWGSGTDTHANPGTIGLVMGGLVMISNGTSILVGLSFSDLRRMSEHMRGMRQTFVERHRPKLLGAALILLSLELAFAILRQAGKIAVWRTANGFAIAISVGIGCWFLFEANAFSSLINRFTTESTSTSNHHAHDSLRIVFVYIRFWTYVATGLLFFFCLLAVVMNFHPYALWRPFQGWGPLWFCIFLTRCLYTLAKIILCRLPSTQRNKRTVLETFTSKTQLQGSRRGTAALSSMNSVLRKARERLSKGLPGGAAASRDNMERPDDDRAGYYHQPLHVGFIDLDDL